mmetsp:Transcript_21615/g.69616  ORF Transcript_21615/g.69616 Transcript_21615/m.69616 type:complete len:231 (+) Transcript_21615:144-836(+)
MAAAVADPDGLLDDPVVVLGVDPHLGDDGDHRLLDGVGGRVRGGRSVARGVSQARRQGPADAHSVAKVEARRRRRRPRGRRRRGEPAGARRLCAHPRGHGPDPRGHSTTLGHPDGPLVARRPRPRGWNRPLGPRRQTRRLRRRRLRGPRLPREGPRQGRRRRRHTRRRRRTPGPCAQLPGDAGGPLSEALALLLLPSGCGCGRWKAISPPRRWLFSPPRRNDTRRGTPPP